MPHWRSRALFLVKLLVAAGFLTWLFVSRKLDLAPLADIRHRGYLLLGAITLGLSMVLPTWRWLGLLGIQKLELAWPKALAMTWLGYFAGLFLPGTAGGDLARAHLACQSKPAAKTRAISTVLMDRIIGLNSLLLLGSVAGVVLLATGCSPRIAATACTSLLLLAGSGVVLLFILWPPTSGGMVRLLPERFRRAMADSLHLYRAARLKLAYLALYSCLCNALAIACYVLAARALGDAFSYGQVLVVPLVVVANSLPTSPGGLGVGETVGALLFAEFGSANGALIILIVRMGLVVFSLPGALAVFGRYRAQGRIQGLGAGVIASSPRPGR